jgi:hypothetical protein
MRRCWQFGQVECARERVCYFELRLTDVGLDILFGLARSGEADSWLVLIRQACFLLLHSMSKLPL